MFSSPTKPSNSPNQDQATSLKNTVNQPGNPSFSKNSPYPEKSRSEIPNNNNPEHVPAYMNSMKIVPSPSFNFAATVGADTTLNVNTQPKNTSYNQSLRTVETSDKLITPEQKITSTKSVKYEIRNENESSKLNKSNSIPVSNEPEKSPQESLISKKQGNSTEANSNASPDNPEISSDAKVVNTKQNSESSKITVTKTSTVAVREPLLDSDRSDIPLNIQMLKQKFKDQEAKLAKADDREEAKNSKANNQAQMANGSRPQTREEELKKEKTKNDPNKMDTYIQNAGKQTDGQSNWLYKKFTEAELVKKEESSRKSETAQNERNEDVKTKVVTEQNVKGNNPRNTQESGHFIEKIRSPAGYSRPGTEAERAKKSAHVPQEGSNQLQLDKTKFMQFAQTQGNQYKEQRGYVQDTSLNVSQSDTAPPSRDPMMTSGGLETSQIMKMGNWQQGGQIDFSAMGMHQMNPQEQQKKTLQIIGFYEQHLNNFKGLIIQQTNVIEAQKLKISSLDNLLKEANDKLKVFEQELYNQAMSHQKAHQELLLKYSETVSQLDRTQTDLEKALKKLGELSLTGNTGDTSKRQASETGSPPRKHEKGKDNLNALYKEISSIKKDLDMQREIMKEIKYSTPTKRERESKGEDLRKSVNGSDYEQTKDECDLVYPLGTPYERHSTGSGLQRKSTSTSVPRLGHRNRSPDIQYEKDESRGRLNRSPFPIEEQMEENARSLNQSKQRSQGTRVRDLLNWQTPAKKRDQESASPNKSSIAFRVDTTNSMDNDANLTCERKTNNRSSSIDANSLSKSCMVDYSSNKKPQKNPEEIEKLQQLIRDLYHEKKSVEETLLHIPENWKTLEQRRKKAKIEAEIEKIEEKMEEYKKRLRDLTGSPVKQRRCAG